MLTHMNRAVEVIAAAFLLDFVTVGVFVGTMAAGDSWSGTETAFVFGSIYAAPAAVIGAIVLCWWRRTTTVPLHRLGLLLVASALLSWGIFLAIRRETIIDDVDAALALGLLAALVGGTSWILAPGRLALALLSMAAAVMAVGTPVEFLRHEFRVPATGPLSLLALGAALFAGTTAVQRLTRRPLAAVANPRGAP